MAFYSNYNARRGTGLPCLGIELMRCDNPLPGMQNTLPLWKCGMAYAPTIGDEIDHEFWISSKGPIWNSENPDLTAKVRRDLARNLSYLHLTPSGSWPAIPLTPEVAAWCVAMMLSKCGSPVQNAMVTNAPTWLQNSPPAAGVAQRIKSILLEAEDLYKSKITDTFDGYDRDLQDWGMAMAMRIETPNDTENPGSEASGLDWNALKFVGLSCPMDVSGATQKLYIADLRSFTAGTHSTQAFALQRWVDGVASVFAAADLRGWDELNPDAWFDIRFKFHDLPDGGLNPGLDRITVGFPVHYGEYGLETGNFYREWPVIDFFLWLVDRYQMIVSDIYATYPKAWVPGVQLGRTKTPNWPGSQEIAPGTQDMFEGYGVSDGPAYWTAAAGTASHASWGIDTSGDIFYQEFISVTEIPSTFTRSVVGGPYSSDRSKTGRGLFGRPRNGWRIMDVFTHDESTASKLSAVFGLIDSDTNPMVGDLWLEWFAPGSATAQSELMYHLKNPLVIWFDLLAFKFMSAANRIGLRDDDATQALSVLAAGGSIDLTPVLDAITHLQSSITTTITEQHSATRSNIVGNLQGVKNEIVWNINNAKGAVELLVNDLQSYINNEVVPKISSCFETSGQNYQKADLERALCGCIALTILRRQVTRPVFERALQVFENLRYGVPAEVEAGSTTISSPEISPVSLYETLFDPVRRRLKITEQSNREAT